MCHHHQKITDTPSLPQINLLSLINLVNIVLALGLSFNGKPFTDHELISFFHHSSVFKRTPSIILPKKIKKQIKQSQLWLGYPGFLVFRVGGKEEELYKILYFNNRMRLQLPIDKIKIDPSCHIQLLRHAQQFQGRNNIYGQLFGALLENYAQVTSVLPLPQGSKTTKEQLEAMEKRNDQLLNNFNLDSQKIGWYFISYTRNFWDNLETMKYYQNYISTSFTLVFDYKARLEGRNPYRAFRLKDDFALKQNFKWSDLQNYNLEHDNPMEQIAVEVQKNQFFELMMLWNKDHFLSGFEEVKKQSSTYQNIKKNIQEYTTAFEVREQIQKQFNDLHSKTQPTQKDQQKSIQYQEYCQYIGQVFKLNNYQNYFNKYIQNNKLYEELFDNPNE